MEFGQQLYNSFEHQILNTRMCAGNMGGYDWWNYNADPYSDVGHFPNRLEQRGNLQFMAFNLVSDKIVIVIISLILVDDLLYHDNRQA